jgi:hypothetical protein
MLAALSQLERWIEENSVFLSLVGTPFRGSRGGGQGVDTKAVKQQFPRVSRRCANHSAPALSAIGLRPSFVLTFYALPALAFDDFLCQFAPNFGTLMGLLRLVCCG